MPRIAITYSLSQNAYKTMNKSKTATVVKDKRKTFVYFYFRLLLMKGDNSFYYMLWKASIQKHKNKGLFVILTKLQTNTEHCLMLYKWNDCLMFTPRIWSKQSTYCLHYTHTSQTTDHTQYIITQNNYKTRQMRSVGLRIDLCCPNKYLCV